MQHNFYNNRIRLYQGDCLEVLKTLPDNCIDSVCTDPPYHLTSIVERFGKKGSAECKEYEGTGVYKRSSKGFMGKEWDGGDIAFRPETWVEVMRVLKPGGHLVSFAATKNYHRMTVAIEDAGFEIRDMCIWAYGQGFPKNHDISKAIDKINGVEFIAKPASGVGFMGPESPGGYNRTVNQLQRIGESSNEAKQWEGWGTALKPCIEPLCLARKPLSEKTIAANVLKWGTGAINIDASRIEAEKNRSWRQPSNVEGVSLSGSVDGSLRNEIKDKSHLGRWPGNLATDGSDEVLKYFPSNKSGTAVQRNGGGQKIGGNGIYQGSNGLTREDVGYKDEGSTARFFYSSKANKKDRSGSAHPTVKPIDLLEHYIKLITPPNGIVLDLFAGSGTTGEAAFKNKFRCVMIEKEQEYVVDIIRRMENLTVEKKE